VNRTNIIWQGKIHNKKREKKATIRNIMQTLSRQEQEIDFDYKAISEASEDSKVKADEKNRKVIAELCTGQRPVREEHHS